MGNRSRNGFVTFDTMLAVIPVMLLLVYLMHANNSINTKIANNYENQKNFDKLVSAANYLVNYGLVKKSSESYYPNWVIEIDESKVNKVGDAAGLNNFRASFELEKPVGNCIYRLVVYGEEKEIRKLYFCEGAE